MRESKISFLVVCLLTLSTLTFAVSVPCACGRIEIFVPPIPAPTPVVQGGIAWAADYNGAPFTWERWIKPIIHISSNGSTTFVTVENGNNGNNKFKFNKDLYVWTSKNKINPDVGELQKILVAENLLGVNSQTGVYDEMTKFTVVAFQKKYNIKPAAQYSFGYFGPITRDFINSKTTLAIK